jgi:uncharacterized repeat protein (TIGR01451 family)
MRLILSVFICLFVLTLQAKLYAEVLPPGVYTYVSADVPKAISATDLDFKQSTVTVTDAGLVSKVRVLNLNVTHTWTNDVRVYITSPRGTTVQLLTGICNGNDNILLNFDDAGAAHNTIPCPMTNNGFYQPKSPLSAFNKEKSAGEWILTVVDDEAPDGGSLQAWTLEVTTTVPENCSNSIDDDGDGLTDGADPDCICEGCGIPIISTYYIPYTEPQIHSALTTIYPGPTPCGLNARAGAPVISYVTLNAYLDSTIVIYDHWEDGFEVDLANPAQATTEIWGDGNILNGKPPGFATDRIMAGQQVIVYKPISPLLPNQQDYDGGDKLVVNFPVSVSRMAWLNGSETLMAGSLEAYPTSEWGTAYTIPIGTNQLTATQQYEYTGLSILASVSSTTVQIDANADGTFETNIVLNEGQSYQLNGGVLAGAKITATSPVQVHAITGDICSSYESRWFAIAPYSAWGTQYYNPVSGSSQLMQVYNPHATALTVRVRTNTGFLADLVVPAVGTTTLPANTATGYHFFSTDGRVFASQVLSDAVGVATANQSFDWGASLSQTGELSQVAAVGYAPGQDPTLPITQNSSPVWYTVAIPYNTAAPTGTANIEVCIDYDGDGVGPLTDTYGQQYDIKQTISELSRQIVYDPDGDQSGMVLYVCNNSTAVISAFWGEDPATATAGSPGLDVGRAIPAINPFYASKTYTIGDVCADGIPGVGDTMIYTIEISNPGLVRIAGFYSITDNLVSALTYVPNTTIRIYNGTTNTISDNSSGTPFPLDILGLGFQSLDLIPGQSALYRFKAVINSIPAGGGLLRNAAQVRRLNISYAASVATVVFAPLETCNNSCDDDGDGLAGCADPDCQFSGSLLSETICIGSSFALTPTISNLETKGSFSLSPLSNTSLCLSPTGLSNNLNARISQVACATTPYQNWELVAVTPGNAVMANGRYYIRDMGSNKNLYPINGSNLADTVVVQSAGSSLIYQWDFVQQPDLSWRITNASTGLVLAIQGASAATGAQLVQQTWTGAAHQKFNLTGVAPAVTYSWSGGLGTAATINVSPTTTTTYTVTITNFGGCITTATSTVTVFEQPVVTLSGAQNACFGGVITLTATVVGNFGTSSYQWQQRLLPAGAWSNVGTNLSQYQVPNNQLIGNYEFRVIVTQNALSCGSGTSNIGAVTIAADPTVNISVNNSIVCTGGASALSATTIGGTGTCQLQWQSSPNGTSSWVDIPGATTNSYLNSGTAIGQTFFRAIFSCTAPGCCN